MGYSDRYCWLRIRCLDHARAGDYDYWIAQYCKLRDLCAARDRHQGILFDEFKCGLVG